MASLLEHGAMPVFDKPRRHSFDCFVFRRKPRVRTRLRQCGYPALRRIARATVAPVAYYHHEYIYQSLAT